MNEQWAVIRIDSDEGGAPIVDVLMVYDGPNAQRDAYRHRDRLIRQQQKGNGLQSITQISGDIEYVVRRVGDPRGDEDKV